MAIDTPKSLRSQVIYSVYTRNHTTQGTFQALMADLDRIQGLGVDILWLMPIHPIGEACRKGTLGSPYAIRDYRSINPELGTLEDFNRLVAAIHARGMKCIIDVVYNHTSPDSVLVQEHPEWFYHREDGSLGNRIGDWTDVVDLDYSNEDLWDYQIETLKLWARTVDGFRCDVAPLVPLAFWQRARWEVEMVRPGCIWLSESVEPEYITHCRSRGMGALSDSEIFQAFDLAYDYDIHGDFRRCLSGRGSLARYAEKVTQQETIYPDNYVKLRYLENHDQPRARFLIPDEQALRAWTAFLYFQKGATMLFGGQETGCSHLPALFDKDPVDWEGDLDLTAQMQTLYRLKKHPLLTDSTYRVWAEGKDLLCACHEKNGQALFGAFAVGGKARLVPASVPDGVYENLAGGRPVTVLQGLLSLDQPAVVLEYSC